jgi:SAM-dependent methyltransferase
MTPGARCPTTPDMPPQEVIPTAQNRSRVKRMRNIGAVISHEIILFELQEFLESNFGGRRSGAVLDLGAGVKPYEPIYERYFESSTSVDVPHSPHDIHNVDILASADDLPLDAESFDCVICTEVLEHCPEPLKALGEIARVLKPGGRVFLTTPFLWPLHEMPHDYYRYTPSGLAQLAETTGLLVKSIHPRGDYTAVALVTLQLPLGKAWYLLAKMTRLPLNSVYNPLVYLTIVLPQQMYLVFWRHVRQHGGRLRRLYDKLAYHTLGYVTELEKPMT